MDVALSILIITHYFATIKYIYNNDGGIALIKDDGVKGKNQEKEYNYYSNNKIVIEQWSI